MFNRLQLQTSSYSQPTESHTPPHIEQAVIRQLQQGSTKLSFFIPQHYEENYSYPLVVWLHGRGGSETQLHRVMPFLSMRNYSAVSVRGTERLEQGWDWDHTPAGIEAAQQRVFEAIDLARERFHVHSERIFLAGYEGGGTLALRLALAFPRQFAGAAAIGSRFPTGTGTLAQLAAVRGFPLFLAQGTESSICSADNLAADLNLMHAASLKVALRLYPCGDEIRTKMLSDLNEWLMERVTGIAVTEGSAEPAFPDLECN